MMPIAPYLMPLSLGTTTARMNRKVIQCDHAADFFALSAAELGGAMVGAFLVWLHHMPHFKTLPEPPAPDIQDELLRSRDALPNNNLR